jgi:uncharacterized protein (DUF1697 family)
MSSNRYIALLRGVNAGRAKRVAMADLCKLIDSLGFADVRSVLNSGNLVFAGPPLACAELAGTIEESLVLKLGVAARVIVLASDELATIIDENPLLAVASDPTRLLAFVLSDPAMRELVAPLCRQDWEGEQLAVGARAAYVWCPQGVQGSAAALALGKQLGDATTSRNWSTMLRLHALCAQAPPLRPVQFR